MTRQQEEQLQYEIICEKLGVKKDKPILGPALTPAIILTNPKNSRNIAMAIRIAANWSAKTILFTGDRVINELHERAKKSGKVRFLREERMRAYSHIRLFHVNYPLNCFTRDITPVAVEKQDNSEWLFEFKHPENAVYVFGPEDGSIDSSLLRLCHRRVLIPTIECQNLAVAVNDVLSDRVRKLGAITRDDVKLLGEV